MVTIRRLGGEYRYRKYLKKKGGIFFAFREHIKFTTYIRNVLSTNTHTVYSMTKLRALLIDIAGWVFFKVIRGESLLIRAAQFPHLGCGN